ncbi:5,6-dimethylbenzimidazole synthase [Stappia indica]|uniref:Cob(II)yrinic acid a,c-diamide reductase n=1 Tax=Stappia indica TaxID=538381 RepID=A0A285RCW1_9HYPH|nr:5,6-dimethylbenzimidazole synthase [Stappia indica]SOB90242.1 cob(II)yrinic acid a,c-diamide reductase [Stappia indica]
MTGEGTRDPARSDGQDGGAPAFGDAFLTGFETLLAWRRDVRRFDPRALPEGLLETLLAQAHMSPSVGNSQPWRFVLVDAPERRTAVRESFLKANADALSSYDGERAELYARLKLEGLTVAPVQLAVFCDEGTLQGEGLGRRTMPEMLAYSCVCAVNTLWLAARARGVGLGWVSIIDPQQVALALDVPDAWRLIAYLCIGYPQEEHDDPELERAGWQARQGLGERLFRR